MSFSLKKKKDTTNPIKVSEQKSFDQIISLPSDSDTDSTQNFISLNDIMYNKSTLNEISTVLDGDGKCSFEANFYVDMENANRANVRNIRISVYTENPIRRVSTSKDSRVGTKQHFNESFLTAMSKKSSSSGGKGFGKSVSSSKNNQVEKTAQVTDVSNLKTLSDGLIKTFDVPLRVTDKTVSDLRTAERATLTFPRHSFDQAGITKSLDATSQVYTALVTPKINLNSSIISQQPINNQSNLVDSKIAQSVGTSFQESTQYLASKALLDAKVDPTSHLNCYYASGPTAGGGSAQGPVRYSLHSTIENEVDVSKSGKDATDTFVTLSPKYRQNSTTQKTSKFSNSYLEALYVKSADISSDVLTKTTFTKVPIKQLSFKSSVRQHQAQFDLDFVSLRPNITKDLFFRIELIDREGLVYNSKIVSVDFRRQLKTILTPNSAPHLKIIEQAEGKVKIEVAQVDPLATDIGIYRMIARPDELDSSSWQKVGSDIRANIKRGPITIVDDQAMGNVMPNVILYEARCSGLYGSMCTSTTKVVSAGVKRLVNLTRPENIGECNIVAAQKGNKIEIKVSGLPLGATRIFLKKQHLNTATREKNFRKHSNVKVQGTSDEFYTVTGNRDTVTFEDTEVINRQIYRYYVQFDWRDRERTNSVSDDYIEYRVVPDRPIIAYLENIESGLDSLGRATVSFDLGANFSDEGLDELNRLLGETGVSSIFVEELRKDRSLVSNLFVYEVTRVNTRTNNALVWPLTSEGKFVDNFITRRTARGAGDSSSDSELVAGRTYIYTARLHIINPERFFKEALTRIPASTKQIINSSDPNFVKVAASKFAENFAIQPGTILSPTTLERDTSFREAALSSYAGIVHRSEITIPLIRAIPKNVKVHRVTAGRPANVIRWELEGSKSSVFSYQVDVSIGRENRFPLRSVSPIVSDDGKYEIRDELFVHEISPVSYSISVIYFDQSKSTSIISNEIHAGSSLPPRILDIAVKKQIPNFSSTDLSSLIQGSLSEKLLRSGLNDPFKRGSFVDKDLSSVSISNNTTALRNSAVNETRQTILNIRNPIRRLREGR